MPVTELHPMANEMTRSLPRYRQRHGITARRNTDYLPLSNAGMVHGDRIAHDRVQITLKLLFEVLLQCPSKLET